MSASVQVSLIFIVLSYFQLKGTCKMAKSDGTHHDSRWYAQLPTEQEDDCVLNSLEKHAVMRLCLNGCSNDYTEHWLEHQLVERKKVSSFDKFFST